MTSRARIEITAEDRGATQKITGIKGLFNDLKAGAKNSILTGVGLGAGISAFGVMQQAVGAVFDQFKQGVDSLLRIEQIGAQTEARLRSTGGAANVTAEGVATLAGSLEKLTGLEAESVQEGQNLLLTFTRVRNEVGAGNDIFDRATGAMADMSVALGMDMSSAAMMLGKALNDPLAGITALQRAGVQLTAAQKEQIKAFVESGDILSAQKIILGEVTTQVGGAAEAFGNTASGKIAKFGHAWGEMVEGVIVHGVEAVESIGHTAGFIALHFGDMGDRANGLAERLGVSFDAIKKQIAERMNETGESVEDALAGIEADATQAASETAASWDTAMLAMARSTREGGAVVAVEVERIAKMPASMMAAENAAIRTAAFQHQVEYAKGLLDGQNEPLVQMEALQQLQEEALTQTEEVARLKGQLFSTSLSAGMASTMPAVRAQAEAARLAIINQLANLGVDASTWGYGIAASLASGLDKGYGVVVDKAGKLAGAVKGQIGIQSEPSDPSSPLRGITRWGVNIVHTLTDGVQRELAHARTMAGQLGKALRPELPALGSLAQTLVPTGVGPFGASTAAPAGAPVVLQLQLDGRTVAQVAQPHLRWMAPAPSGVLPD